MPNGIFRWGPAMPFRMILVVGSCVAIAAFAAAPRGIAHDHATGVVRERMEAMETMAKAMKAIRAHLDGDGTLEPVRAGARSIQALATECSRCFRLEPASIVPRLSARFGDWPDFEAKARTRAAESARLAEAGSRDAQVISAQARMVSNACGSCHEALSHEQRH
jgi:cytochrome c556